MKPRSLARRGPLGIGVVPVGGPQRRAELARPSEVFRCVTCGRGWLEALAFVPARDLVVDGVWPWLCLDCAALGPVQPHAL